jgi:hypothetical protein
LGARSAVRLALTFGFGAAIAWSNAILIVLVLLFA